MTTDFEFMTYQEAAERLNIAQASVKRQATRNKWPKRKGNNGRVSVGIPIIRLSPDSRDDSHPDSRDDSHPDSQEDSHPIHQLQMRVAVLEIELVAERQMKEMAMQDRDAWKEQAQRQTRPWWKKFVG